MFFVFVLFLIDRGQRRTSSNQYIQCRNENVAVDVIHTWPGNHTRSPHARARTRRTDCDESERERETEGGEDASRWSASLLMRGSTDTLFLHLTPKNLRALLKALKTKQVSADTLSETAHIQASLPAGEWLGIASCRCALPLEGLIS